VERKELYLILAVVVTFIFIASALFTAGGITGGIIIKSVSCFEDKDCNDHNEETTDFCTADALECSDGTFVARNPANNCEFFDCPVVNGNQELPLGEQVVGPEYYNSEQAAFDALNQELDQMDDVSIQELESMLGE